MVRLKAFTYAMPCTNRALAYLATRKREGLFLCIDNEEQRFGIGEFAPLIGIHHETIDEVLRVIADMSLDEVAPIFALPRNMTVSDLAEFFARYPARVNYLLSMAHFHNSFVARGSSSPMINLAALIEVGVPEQAIQLAQSYVAQGFSCLKIKVGSLTIENEINKIKIISAMVGEKVSLRLDANRRFTFKDAVKLLKALRKVNIEYFEDPLVDISQLRNLFDECGVVLAADELVESTDDLPVLVDAGVGRVVIKLQRFATIFDAIKIIQAAKRMGITPILSHCFESEFSSAIAAMVIDACDLYGHAHGVIVDGMFKSNVFQTPMRSFRGRLSFESVLALSKSEFLANSNVINRAM